MRKVLIAAGIIMLSACARSDQNPAVVLLSPGGNSVTVQIEIADDEAERQKGLMERTELDDDAGMLFVFPKPQSMAFWMKNTLIPLDILYFDADGRLVSFATMEPCTKDPCKTYPALGPAQYALEVNAGVVKEKGIGAGWVLKVY